MGRAGFEPGGLATAPASAIGDGAKGHHMGAPRSGPGGRQSQEGGAPAAPRSQVGKPRPPSRPARPQAPCSTLHAQEARVPRWGGGGQGRGTSQAGPQRLVHKPWEQDWPRPGAPRLADEWTLSLTARRPRALTQLPHHQESNRGATAPTAP